MDTKVPRKSWYLEYFWTKGLAGPWSLQCLRELVDGPIVCEGDVLWYGGDWPSRRHLDSFTFSLFKIHNHNHKQEFKELWLPAHLTISWRDDVYQLARRCLYHSWLYMCGTIAILLSRRQRSAHRTEDLPCPPCSPRPPLLCLMTVAKTTEHMMVEWQIK